MDDSPSTGTAKRRSGCPSNVSLASNDGTRGSRGDSVVALATENMSGSGQAAVTKRKPGRPPKYTARRSGQLREHPSTSDQPNNSQTCLVDTETMEHVQNQVRPKSKHTDIVESVLTSTPVHPANMKKRGRPKKMKMDSSAIEEVPLTETNLSKAKTQCVDSGQSGNMQVETGYSSDEAVEYRNLSDSTGPDISGGPKRRGRPPQRSVQVSPAADISEVPERSGGFLQNLRKLGSSGFGKDNPDDFDSSTMRKRGRPKKTRLTDISVDKFTAHDEKVPVLEGDHSGDKDKRPIDKEKTEANVSLGKRKRGRLAKIAASSQEGTESVSITVQSMRALRGSQRDRSLDASHNDMGNSRHSMGINEHQSRDDAEENSWQGEESGKLMKTPGKKRGKKTAPTKPQGPFKCVHCHDAVEDSYHQMLTHMLREHHRMWKPSNPEGEENIPLVVKMLGKISCKDCGKVFRSVSYYRTHIKWCGREDELRTCEECGSVVKAMWFDIHERAHMKKQLEAKKREEARLRQNTEEKPDTSVGKARRLAASKALATMKDVCLGEDTQESQDSDATDYGSGNDDTDDDDERDDDDADDADDDDDEMNSSDEEEDELDFGDTIGKIRMKPGAIPTFGARSRFPTGHTLWPRCARLNQERIEKLTDVKALPKWISSISDWKKSQLSKTEAELYLPVIKTSANFKIRKLSSKDKNTGRINQVASEELKSESIERLDLFQTKKLESGHMTFVGGPIWAMDWCSYPVPMEANQYLAVSTHRSPEQLTPLEGSCHGPAVIQLWNCGLLLDSTGTGSDIDDPPRLEACIASDYGSILNLQWCPHGTYNPEDGRLGLLAAATTSGLILLYSIPLLEKLCVDKKDDGPKVFRVKPTAILSSTFSGTPDAACLCVAWHISSQPGASSQLAAGFADGSVSVWDVATRSHLLQSYSAENVAVIHPRLTYWAHKGPVSAMTFAGDLQHFLCTTSYDRYQKTWDLRDIDHPLCENLRTKLNAICFPPFWPHCYISGDDCFTYGSNAVFMTERQNTGWMRPLSGFNTCIWDMSHNSWLHNLVVCDAGGTVMYYMLYPTIEPYKRRKDFNKARVPVMTTAEVTNTPHTHGSDEDVCRTKRQQISENTAANDCRPSDDTCLEFTFFSYPKKLKQTNYKVEDVNITKSSNRQVHKVVFNPNASSYQWLTYGGQAGLLFVRSINT